MRLFTTGLLLTFVLLPAACSGPPPAPDIPLTLYPQPPEPPRIQYLRSFTLGSDIEDPSSGLNSLLFGDNQLEKAFMAPYGATIHEGIIYVCDIQQGAILTLDLAARKMDFIHTSGRGELQKPVNLSFGPDGRLYVADLGRRQLVIYDREFNYVNELGPFEGDNSKVVDVEIFEDRLFVLDSGMAKIHVYDRESLEELLVIGEDTATGTKLKAPTNLSIDKQGRLLVVDSILCQVFIWSPEGELVGTIGSPGDIVGQFARPKGIAYADGLVFVVDSSFENCQIFDASGEILLFFGNPGVQPGNLYLPAGVWVGEEGLELFQDDLAEGFHAEKLIIVTNLYGPHKVNIYALGKMDGFDYPE